MNQYLDNILISSGIFTVAFSTIAFIGSVVFKSVISYLNKIATSNHKKDIDLEIEKYKSELSISVEKYKSVLSLEVDNIKSKELEIGRWCNIMLSSSNGLYGRICDIKKKKEFEVGLEFDEYYNLSTKYYISRFLAFNEIFRRTRDSIIFSPVKDEMEIYELLKNISISFRNDNFNGNIIRSLEQMYIAESMFSKPDDNYFCIGYKEFISNNDIVNYEPLSDFVEYLLNEDSVDRIDDIVKNINALRTAFLEILNRQSNL
ncbi:MULTISPECIES: hypothetical protein [unclassified Photobacterium]|uniref:hypothetical protein n=1 Tax=unclassified Photobacterium TaxID=2628852 RepID=UPI001EDFB87C|nr:MULTISPECIES: hypothetical protein [unclassified Photobacterium]MCG3862639.1 hypothetical protein [Photobacterium sp. Ph6]MCG3874170.1 hypothetical protein [Photobacterium sp. Ph5]